MNNLKKVLALGLALVMLFSMFTVASAAKDSKMVASDLADWDTVAHKDAVSLMVDLGIIKGIEADGKVSFQPTANIDRASWAKMVYYAATGSEDADAYLGTASGLSDIAGNWAESYISFLAANQYVAGDGTGKYNPSNNVTVAEACKTMLTVLGYDAEDRGYQNTAAWAGNIMVDAKRNGLMDNVDSAQTALVPLTRENAAELVLNTLNANTVESESRRDQGQAYVVSYTKGAPLSYEVFDMVKVTATISGLNEDGMAIFDGAALADVYNKTWRVGDFISNKVRATASMIGDEADVYVKAEDFKWKEDDKGDLSETGNALSVISSTAAKASVAPVKTITNGIGTWPDEVTTRGTANFVALEFDPNCAYYYNGNGVSNRPAVLDDVVRAARSRGTVVNFYTNENGHISKVKAYEYTVDMVENGNAESKTQSDGTVLVKVPGVTGWVESDKISGWQGLVEGDVVLVYTTALEGGTGSNTKCYTLEKAEKVSGKVTSTSRNGELTVGGKNYKGSEQNNAGAIGDVQFDKKDCAKVDFSNWGRLNGPGSLTDEYDFFLDKSGAIAAINQITEGVDTSRVCLVLGTEIIDKGLGSNGLLRAELLFVDGTTEIVNVTKIGRKSVVDEVADKYADRQILLDDANAALGTPKTKFFNYRATTAGYELTALNATEDPRNWSDPVATAEKADQATVVKEPSFAKQYGETAGSNKNFDWSIKADDATTFVVGKVASDNTVSYSVYKGFANVPSMDVNMMSAICARVNSVPSNVAKFVYLETGAFKDDVPDGFVFICGSNGRLDPELGEQDDVWVIDIIDVDGTPTTMRVTGSLMDDIAGDSLKFADSRTYVGKFFAIGDIDENGVVSRLTDGEKKPTDDRAVDMLDLVTLGGSMIERKGDATSYSYDASTKFVYVDMGWMDNDEDDNTPNVFEPHVDKIVYREAGTFSPTGFFNEDEVKDFGYSTDTKDPNPDGYNYMTVTAAVVCPEGSTVADYVYVLRLCW